MRTEFSCRLASVAAAVSLAVFACTVAYALIPTLNTIFGRPTEEVARVALPICFVVGLASTVSFAVGLYHICRERS